VCVCSQRHRSDVEIWYIEAGLLPVINYYNFTFLLSFVTMKKLVTLNTFLCCSITANTWTHIAFTWNHNTGYHKVYINAQSSSSATVTASSKWFQATNPTYRIGKGFQGWMNDLIVVSKVLTTEEINDLRLMEVRYQK
jgi:hypothetical protein